MVVLVDGAVPERRGQQYVVTTTNKQKDNRQMYFLPYFSTNFLELKKIVESYGIYDIKPCPYSPPPPSDMLN